MKELHTIHGLSKSGLRTIWVGMVSRCNNPKDINYFRYGAKGITVCKEWMDLQSFAAWALSHGYSDGLSLDRIDNFKGYSPDNCRWCTWEEQCNNKTNNHLLTVNGITDTIANWSKITGLSHSTISERLRNGWSEEKAVTMPKRGYKCQNSA